MVYEKKKTAPLSLIPTISAKRMDGGRQNP